MTPTTKNIFKTLDLEELRALARREGPCLTAQVPAYQPGAGGGSRHAHLRQLTQNVLDRLRAMNRTPEIKAVETSFENLVAALDDGSGGPALTMFCAPGFEAVYETPHVRDDHFMIGSRFRLSHVAGYALEPKEFFILGLSKKKIRLYRYEHGRCEEVTLPAQVPESLEAAGGFDKPDHDLENRSSGGPGAGSMKGVRFSTLSDEEASPEYMHHFWVLVDKGLRDVLKGQPLLLAGVREELVEYRRAAKHSPIFEAEFNGNADRLSTDELAQKAREAARREYQRKCEDAINGLQEVRDKIVGDVREILRAAREGRVWQFFAAEGARLAGDPSAGVFHGEDLVNAALVEALRTSAEIYMFPGGDIPGVGIVAARLRY
jgi:hypothetical protein